MNNQPTLAPKTTYGILLEHREVQLSGARLSGKDSSYITLAIFHLGKAIDDERFETAKNLTEDLLYLLAVGGRATKHRTETYNLASGLNQSLAAKISFLQDLAA